MINRDVFMRDPALIELLNNGVAQVNDDRSDAELRTLRYELRTFVCEGHYEVGLRKILDAYLQNLSRPEQPGVWVSGFYGSGKSHFLKILRALWTDRPFPEQGDTPRSLVELPQDIRDQLISLSTEGRRFGGLHAAAGTLGAGASSVRLALLSILFRSVGLPAEYDRAQFVMWLRDQGVLEQVHADITAQGISWENALARFSIHPIMARVVHQRIPGLATAPAEVSRLLNDRFPVYRPDQEIDTSLMLEAIQRALAPDGRFPCTLVGLDEVQQYINDRPERAYAVQEVVEHCSKKFAGRLLFLGTGQTSMSSTAQLLKLKGRFPVEVELSDTDVDTVIRRIILQKKSSTLPALKTMLGRHSGEISRHLVGTRLESRKEDETWLVEDYPLLPVRRKLWKKVLRAVDSGGTVGQLRNQLKAVFDAVRQSADAPLGTVVGGDFIYFNLAPTLLQTGVLPREVDNDIRPLMASTDPEQQLSARIIALVFLIGKLPREGNADDGVRATPEVLCDLLVENLVEGSSDLRRRVPTLCAALVEQGLLMQVESEFRVQTRESQAWQANFDEAFRGWTDIRLSSAREELLQTTIQAALKPISITQGNSKVKRELRLHFGAEWPKEDKGSIFVWVRNRFNERDADILSDAQRSGTQAATLFVFLLNPYPDDFHKSLRTIKAAEETLSQRGTPTTPEGVEARNAIETRRANAQQKLRSLLDEIAATAIVYQSGGQIIQGSGLADKLRLAAQNALIRLFPRFDMADNPRWSAVLTQARQGHSNALEQVGYTGDVDKNPVCMEILRACVASIKGNELRSRFEEAPYGWPRDSVDGAIHILLLTDHLRASSGGVSVTAQSLERTRINTVEFRAETIVVTATERMMVRKLLQEGGVTCKSGEETLKIPVYLKELKAVAQSAGGEPPAPERPVTTHIDELLRLSGNAQIKRMFEEKERLGLERQEWQALSETIVKRWPRWETLQELYWCSKGLPSRVEATPEVEALQAQRRLLANPDPVPPLCDQLSDALREAIIQAREEFSVRHAEEIRSLEEASAWKKLNLTQQHQLEDKYNFKFISSIHVSTEAELIHTAKNLSMHWWQSQRDALPQRMNQIRLEAARMVEPKATEVRFRRATLQNSEEAEAWMAEVRQSILAQLEHGPVIV